MSYETSASGEHLTGAIFDTSDRSCFTNSDDSFTSESLCIHGIFYDSIGPFEDTATSTSGSCITINLSERVFFPSEFFESWGLDGLDSDTSNNIIYDGEYTYYDLPNTIDLYVVDNGIRGDHEEFEGRVIDLGIYDGKSWFNDSFWDNVVYHGTTVASNMGGYYYGSSKNQRIYNINFAFGLIFGQGVNPFGLVYYSDTLLLLGLQDILNNMITTGRKGVVNMSFNLFWITDSERELIDDFFEAIYNFGSINVAAAGNSPRAQCDYPASSDYVIAVGAYDEDLTLASFGAFGECVDVYGPGYLRWGANDNTNSSYHQVSGTSFAAPTIGGIIANYLLECEDTGYYDQCTFEAIKLRLSEPFVNITANPLLNFEGIKRCSNENICNGVVYQCGVPFCMCNSLFAACDLFRVRFRPKKIGSDHKCLNACIVYTMECKLGTVEKDQLAVFFY